MEGDYFLFDSVKKKKTGQTTCNVCRRVYNNAAIPKYCLGCNSYFPTGKVQTKKSKIKPQAYLISDNIASVREHPRGHNTRTFVSIGTEKKVGFNKVTTPSLTLHVEG